MDRVGGNERHSTGNQNDDEGHSEEYDWGETLPSLAVVEAVTAAIRCRATDLAPLYGTIDPDSLDELLASGQSTEPGTTVSFTYAGCDVVLDGDGTVRATPIG